MLRHSGHFSEPDLLTYLESNLRMSGNHQPTEPVPDENAPDAPAPDEQHPIDVTIGNIDKAVNELRAHASTLNNNATSRCVTDSLNALVALQAFTREVRKLFGDIL
jgi:hypothetical protein